jgi:hypothetical protein
MPEPPTHSDLPTYEVRREVDIRRHGAGWIVEENDAEGSVEVPEHAAKSPLRAPDVGALYEWAEDDFATSSECPRCVSPRPCHQHIKLYTHTATVVVIHEAEGDARCN